MALLSVLVLSGCGSHDQEYYQDNLEEAEVKLAECTKQMMSAFMIADEAGFKAVSEDQECIAADRAIRADKDLQRKTKAEARDRQRQEAQVKFDLEYRRQLEALNEMPYVEFANIAKDCGFIAASPKCKAYSELEKQRHNREVELLVDRYSGSELLALHKPRL